MTKGQKFTTDTPTMDEIRRLKKKHTTSVDMVIDPEINNEIVKLRRQHLAESNRDTKENRTPKAPAILKKIEALEKEALDVTVTFTFQDIGRKKFEDEWKSCPPTDEQRELGYEWNPDEFGPIILAAASLEPKLTLKEAQEIYDEWSTAEAEMLVMSAIYANMGVSSIPLSGTAIGGQPPFDSNLITAPVKESPTPST